MKLISGISFTRNYPDNLQIFFYIATLFSCILVSTETETWVGLFKRFQAPHDVNPPEFLFGFQKAVFLRKIAFQK